MNSNLEHLTDVGNRARIILSEIVDSYLNTGSPVSSKVISESLNSVYLHQQLGSLCLI